MITDLVWKSLEKGGNHWHFKGLVFRSVHDYFIANSSFCIWILSWNYYHYLRKRLPLTIQDIWKMKWMRESCWYSFWEAKSTLSCSKSVCRGCSVVQLLIAYLIKEIRTKNGFLSFFFEAVWFLIYGWTFAYPWRFCAEPSVPWRGWEQQQCGAVWNPLCASLEWSSQQTSSVRTDRQTDDSFSTSEDWRSVLLSLFFSCCKTDPSNCSSGVTDRDDGGRRSV